MITVISGITVDQAAVTEETMQQTNKILDYVALQEDPDLTYSTSNMILIGHSNAGNLDEKNKDSCIGGHWFMSKDVKYPLTTASFLTSHR